jgi:hypothetical protein
VGHLLLELADVIGLSEAGLAPDLLAESVGEAVLELADAGGQAGGALVGGEQVGLQRGPGSGSTRAASAPLTPYLCSMATEPRRSSLPRFTDPADRSLGVKTLHIGMVEDTDSSPERFFCASEQMAVVPIPSLTSQEAFDSGVVFGPALAARLIDHGRQAYASARRIETIAAVRGLRVIKDTEGRV